jgi:hypothetical protein
VRALGGVARCERSSLSPRRRGAARRPLLVLPSGDPGARSARRAGSRRADVSRGGIRRLPEPGPAAPAGSLVLKSPQSSRSRRGPGEAADIRTRHPNEPGGSTNGHDRPTWTSREGQERSTWRAGRVHVEGQERPTWRARKAPRGGVTRTARRCATAIGTAGSAELGPAVRCAAHDVVVHPEKPSSFSR